MTLVKLLSLVGATISLRVTFSLLKERGLLLKQLFRVWREAISNLFKCVLINRIYQWLLDLVYLDRG